MPTHNRNDTPILAKRPEWLPVVSQARANGSTRGLPTPPPGIERTRGAYYHINRSIRVDGSVRVYVKWCRPGGRTTTLGSYLVTDSNPRVPVGKVITLRCGRQVRVALDADNLPYPVPVW